RLDLDAEADRQRLRDLLPHVDVVLESFPPGRLDRLGLGPGALRRLNPGLILASVAPFGRGGPFRDLRGSALTAWAMGGCLVQTGDPARPPLSPPGRRPTTSPRSTPRPPSSPRSGGGGSTGGAPTSTSRSRRRSPRWRSRPGPSTPT